MYKAAHVIRRELNPLYWQLRCCYFYLQFGSFTCDCQPGYLPPVCLPKPTQQPKVMQRQQVTSTPQHTTTPQHATTMQQHTTTPQMPTTLQQLISTTQSPSTHKQISMLQTTTLTNEVRSSFSMTLTRVHQTGLSHNTTYSMPATSTQANITNMGAVTQTATSSEVPTTSERGSDTDISNMAWPDSVNPLQRPEGRFFCCLSGFH